MNEPTRGGDAPAQKSDPKPALLGVTCGAGAALFWALGFVATRHGLKVGFTPPDLLMHRFLWSGIAFLPLDPVRVGFPQLGFPLSHRLDRFGLRRGFHSPDRFVLRRRF